VQRSRATRRGNPSIAAQQHHHHHPPVFANGPPWFRNSHGPDHERRRITCSPKHILRAGPEPRMDGRFRKAALSANPRHFLGARRMPSKSLPQNGRQWRCLVWTSVSLGSWQPRSRCRALPLFGCGRAAEAPPFAVRRAMRSRLLELLLRSESLRQTNRRGCAELYF